MLRVRQVVLQPISTIPADLTSNNEQASYVCESDRARFALTEPSIGHQKYLLRRAIFREYDLTLFYIQNALKQSARRMI